MFRVNFSAEDLLRTRFAAAPAPLLELGLAFAMLRRTDGPVFADWRDRARARLPRTARPMFELVPATGAGPTFLDPVSDGFADGLDRVLSTRRGVVHAEFDRVFAAAPRVSPWVRALADRDGEAWSILAAALASAYRAVLAGDWPRVLASHRGDIAYRSGLITIGGLHAAVASTYPGAYWDGTVLCVPSTVERELTLDGLGATLMPSAFWTGQQPLHCEHPDGSRLFVYPSAVPLPLVDGSSDTDPLAALLGATRAAVLRSLTAERTTSELAADLGISIATASEHAKTLRAGGLVSSTRSGKSVLHSCTPLGWHLQLGVTTAG